MQISSLVRLFSSSRLRISTRPTFPSYQLASGLKTLPTAGSSLPVKPKRPVNAYIRYAQSVRSSLANKNPKASPAEISKLAAAQWQDLDQSIKNKLEEEYKKEQAVWLQQNAKYLSALTEEQKQEIRQARVEKTEEKAKREYRRRVKELGKPKRPLNGFLLFCADQKPKQLTKEENQSYIKQLAEKWAKMGDTQKEPYTKRAAEALVKYRDDMKQWEDQMIAQDNMDVIRRKHILIPTKKDAKTKRE